MNEKAEVQMRKLDNVIFIYVNDLVDSVENEKSHHGSIKIGCLIAKLQLQEFIVICFSFN